MLLTLAISQFSFVLLLYFTDCAVILDPRVSEELDEIDSRLPVGIVQLDSARNDRRPQQIDEDGRADGQDGLTAAQFVNVCVR